MVLCSCESATQWMARPQDRKSRLFFSQPWMVVASRLTRRAEAKEPSSTMLYVSNLPFSFESPDLRGVFSSFEVTSAYVATRRNGRSKVSATHARDTLGA